MLITDVVAIVTVDDGAVPRDDWVTYTLGKYRLLQALILIIGERRYERLKLAVDCYTDSWHGPFTFFRALDASVGDAAEALLFAAYELI